MSLTHQGDSSLPLPFLSPLLLPLLLPLPLSLWFRVKWGVEMPERQVQGVNEALT